MTPVEVIVVLGVTSFVVTLAVVPIVRRVALGYGITDNPGGHKHHAAPVPYLGGVAIAVCALAASALLPGWTAQAAVGVLAAVIVGATGLVDDVRMLSPATRLVPEILAAGIVVWSGDRVTLFGGWVDSGLTIVWLVVITNAFNLLDNVDGAAGLIATTIALGMAVSAALQGQWLVGGLAAVLAGSCLGFLRYNWYPARIFMGDAGSLFLGFLLAVIALKLRFPIAHKGSVPAVILLASPALFDTTMVVISRIRARHPIYLGARDHTSHRLLRLGLSTRAVAAVLAAGSACTTALGVAVGRGVVPSAKVVVPIVGVAGLVIMVLLLRVPAGYDELTRPRQTSALERA